MADILRDAPLGQFVRFVTRSRLLQYPEEKESFISPYYHEQMPESEATSDGNSTLSTEYEVARNLQRTRTQSFTNERMDSESKVETQKSQEIPVVPVRTQDGVILVDWYSTSDPENPQNWSQKKKAFVALQI
jgi:DHA1 family multidrug resistance protein-like MFS transporter